MKLVDKELPECQETVYNGCFMDSINDEREQAFSLVKTQIFAKDRKMPLLQAFISMFTKHSTGRH